MKSLTIITPTYNRANLLMNLYHSLEKQINKDFCWMVVDDGSSDGTFEIINNLVTVAPFEIVCLNKKNGGKHTALNYGIRQIQSPLTVIVDSDDYLTCDAVQSILNIHKKYINNNSIGSYTFLKGYNNNKPVVTIGKDEFVANYLEYRIKNHHPGDMVEVFRTEYLKNYPFPEYPGENFISEDVVWIEIAKHSDSVYNNKVIYICEYLDGGLTSNDKKMKFTSPLGSMMRGKQLMSVKCGIIENIRGAIIYSVYRYEARKRNVEDSNLMSLSIREKCLVLSTILLSFGFYKKWHNGI